MLHELTIRNFAIIEYVRLEFRGGLLVFTGETGAGKSIVLDAIGAILGARVGAEFVRSGAAKAVIEGVFILPWLPLAVSASQDVSAPSSESDSLQQNISALLEDLGIEIEDDTLIISREIAANGRSSARINGSAVAIGALARLGSLLIDSSDQHEHLKLLKTESHIGYLDRFAALQQKQRGFAAKYSEWKALRREWAALQMNERETARRAELLQYQVDEIDSAHLLPNEPEDLENEKKILANAEHINAEITTALACLNGSESDDSVGCFDLLASLEKIISSLVRYDASLETQVAAIRDSVYQLEDAAQSLKKYAERIEADPQRLDEVENRLAVFRTLKRKYGATVAEIQEFGRNAQKELHELLRKDERLAELAAEIETLRNVLGALADELTLLRTSAAEQMQMHMEALLEKLHMRNTRFVIHIDKTADADGVPCGPEHERLAVNASGADAIEFLFSANAGEPVRSLAKIASGGEMSRVMLALKTMLSDADETPIQIFDEIDAGIGGATGQIVGEMLWKLAQRRQVFCVTHLPQMAIFADQHWQVSKSAQKDHTQVHVTELDRSTRVREIAQMLGGVITEHSLRNAEDLLLRAEKWKTYGSADEKYPKQRKKSLRASG